MMIPRTWSMRWNRDLQGTIDLRIPGKSNADGVATMKFGDKWSVLGPNEMEHQIKRQAGKDISSESSSLALSTPWPSPLPMTSESIPIAHPK